MADNNLTYNCPPLCVDLDGTLIHGDTGFMSVWLALRQKPWLSLAMPWWFRDGRAALKHQLASHIRFNPKKLVYNDELIQFLKQQQKQDRKLLLVTGSNYQIAQHIAKHLPLFDEVLASDYQLNLTGTRKATKLQQRFNTYGFDYIGDSFVDIPVYHAARKIYVVSKDPKLIAAANAIKPVERVFHF